MYDPLSLKQERKQTQNQKQTQKLIMSPQMQQSIKLLQMPIMELEQLIDHELEQNPLLEKIEEYDDDLPNGISDEIEQDGEQAENIHEELEFTNDSFEGLRDLDDYFDRHFSDTENYCLKRTIDEEKKKSYFENNIRADETLETLLYSQAREVCNTPDELAAVECIIGNLDNHGFIAGDLKEIALLHGIEEPQLERAVKILQTFEPPGIGATCVRECLLIQLERKGLSDTLPYHIVNHYYDDLLHSRVKAIAKGLNYSEKFVSETITNVISKLDLQPGSYLSNESAIAIIPDIQIIYEDEELKIKINNEFIPDLQVSKQYLQIVLDPETEGDTKHFIKQKISSAKWLMRNIMQRSDTLERLARKLVDSQRKFFTDSHGQLIPMTMKQVAEELELHESTIARAVSNKYLSCDRGVFPLRSFFTNALSRDKGDELSSRSVKDILADLINKENKQKPHSDESLSKLLKEKGIRCARRTIAKYRTELNIGNTKQRKQYL